MKKCKKCGLIKEVDCFHKDKKTKDKLGSYCRDCANNDAKLWMRKQRLLKTDVAKRQNIRITEWRKKHKEVYVQYAREYRLRHKDRMVAQIKSHWLHPDVDG